MGRFIHLSHVMTTEDIAWPGEPVLTVDQDHQIGVDDAVFNSAVMHLPNHFGTHMDGPHHFTERKIDFADLPIETFGFTKDQIFVANLPELGVPGTVVMKKHLEPMAEQIRGKGILLLRTGFERYRSEDPETYQMRGLSLHPDLCEWLNIEFPDLKVIGMDWMSIATPANDYGRPAHQWLLGEFTDHVICGIEDMSMVEIGDSELEFLTLGPLRVKGVDSAQVNAMAYIAD